MIDSLFDRTIDVLGSALDLRAARHKLLASNIANQETPGYRAVDIRFEDEMKKNGGQEGGMALQRTSPAHILFVKGGPASPMAVDRATDAEGYDRNSVGIDSEMVKIADNSLMYNVASKMLRSKFSTLMTAIREGK